MCKKLKERELEVLKATLSSQRFYHVYKKTSIPLATAWRIVRNLAKAGYVEYHNGYVKITETGLILLASYGDAIALSALARRYNTTITAVKEFVNLLCQKMGNKDLPMASLVDALGLIGIEILEKLKNSPAEELAVKLLLDYCKDCIIEINGSKFLFGGRGIIAAYCKFCRREGVFELYPDCPYFKNFFKHLEKQFLNAAKNQYNADKKT